MSDFIPNLMQWERKEADLYPTPPEGTVSVLNFLEAGGVLAPGMKILEPASGDGDIARVLVERGYDVTSTDIRPDVFHGRGGVDYLDQPPAPQMRYDAVFTNPPFSLASSFLRAAWEDAPIVVLLLKTDYFQADTRYGLYFDQIPAFVCPMTFRLAFLKEERGNNPFMNCTWFIWIRGLRAAHYVPIRRPPDCEVPFRGLLPGLERVANAMQRLVDELR